MLALIAVLTGKVGSWAGDITQIGPLYPFVGMEVWMWIIGLVGWILWHIWQTHHETKTHEEDSKRLGKKR